MECKFDTSHRTYTEDDARTNPQSRGDVARTQAAHAESTGESRPTTGEEREMAEREASEGAPEPSERLEAEVRELEVLRAQLVTALGRQSASLTILRKAVEEADHASEMVQGLRKQIGLLEKKLEQGGRKQRAAADASRERALAPRLRAG